MLQWRRGLTVVLVTLAVLSVTWVPVVTAHPRDRDGDLASAVGSERAAPVSPALPAVASGSAPAAEAPAATPHASGVVLLVVLFILGLAAVRRPGATVNGLLATLLLVAAIESAVHSVHHLDNPQAATKCQVLTVTQQLHGETSPEVPSGQPVATFRAYAAPVLPWVAVPSVRRPDEGRAPPLPIA